MKHYKQTVTNLDGSTFLVLRREDGAQIPLDEGNRDFRAFLELGLDVEDLEEAPLA
jgi:hypothetical protein